MQKRSRIINFYRNHLNFSTWVTYLLVVGALALALPSRYLLSRWGLILWMVFPLLTMFSWLLYRKVATDRVRRMGADPSRVPRPFRKAWHEWLELILFVDDASRRRTVWTLFAIGLVASAITPFGLRNGEFIKPSLLTATGAFGGILVWLIYTSVRCHFVFTERQAQIELIYNIARIPLKYPRKKVRPARDEIPFQRADTSIQVHQWESMTDPRSFTVLAPPTLDMEDMGAWNIFHANIEKRLPLETGWHREELPRGTGYQFGPADYPTGVQWDGEVADEPLDFYLGADLDRPGEHILLTFSDSSPHFLVIGGTGTGKTSAAEAIIAQAAIKPMPWSTPDNPIYAQTYIADPKGPFASRWEGRPNIHVVNGVIEGENEDGDIISGVERMAELVGQVHDLMKERQELITQYGADGNANWFELPEEVLKAQRLAPIFLILDEYLDLMDRDSSKSEEVERDNAAKQFVEEKAKYIMRKGRSLGVHLGLLAQEANMTLIGSTLIRNAPVHIMMGNMDGSIYKTFFGFKEERIPPLPADRTVKTARGHEKKKPIPGRGRIQPTSGAELMRMQAFWFGGENNSETLDKWLPRTKRSSSQASVARQEEMQIDEVAPAPTPRAPIPPSRPVPTEEVVPADQLFGGGTVEEHELPEHPCFHHGCTNVTVACGNPRCPEGNYVCDEHGVTPDGVRLTCPTCYSTHLLAKAGLSPLMPWLHNVASKRGATINYTSEGTGAAVRVTIDGIELVVIRGSEMTGVSAMDGEKYARTEVEIKAMVTNALKGKK